MLDTEESFERKVERIAKAWIARPCPPDEEPYCNPAMHVWETMHPEDQAYAREHVAFALREAGLE
jgi:hypothetical protein